MSSHQLPLNASRYLKQNLVSSSSLPSYVCQMVLFNVCSLNWLLDWFFFLYICHLLVQTAEWYTSFSISWHKFIFAVNLASKIVWQADWQIWVMACSTNRNFLLVPLRAIRVGAKLFRGNKVQSQSKDRYQEELSVMESGLCCSYFLETGFAAPAAGCACSCTKRRHQALQQLSAENCMWISKRNKCCVGKNLTWNIQIIFQSLQQLSCSFQWKCMRTLVK